MGGITFGRRSSVTLLALLTSLAPPLAAQQSPATAPASIAIANAGFEDGVPGAAPPQWGVGGAATPNYRVLIDADNPREGRTSARLERLADDAQSFGTLASTVDARPFRGHRIRLTAAVRTEAADPGRVGLWLRIDRAARRMDLIDNMMNRPIHNPAWSDYVIEGNVAVDAESIVFGLLIADGNRAWIDDVRLQDLGPVPPASAAAIAYLDAAIALIRDHHINSGSADWPAIIAAAHAAIAGAATPRDTYAAIGNVLLELHEPHSFLVPPPAAGAGRPVHALPAYSLIDGRFGLVRLPGFLGSTEEGRPYMERLRDGLVALDRHELCGWIVDLSGDAGGNMWPMVNGLDPLLGPAPFGSFRQPSGNLTYWVRRDGKIAPGPPDPGPVPYFRLRQASLPVAVILGSGTASSGEITATAMIGRDGVRTFGTPTAGFATSNENFRLADGAVLLVTSAFVRDRMGHEYRTRLTPDEPTTPATALAAARHWLAAQGCASRPQP